MRILASITLIAILSSPGSAGDPGELITFGIRAPDAIQGLPGETRTLDVDLTVLDSSDIGDAGVQGWTMSVFSEGGTIDSISVDGLVVSAIYDDLHGDHRDPYLLDLGHSWIQLSQLATKYQDPQKKGAVSVVIMSTEAVVRLKSGIVQKVASLEVTATIPQGDQCVPMTIFYEDGAQAHEVVHNQAIYGGDQVVPRLISATVMLCPARFRRGDANADATVDISDPIFTLNYLYTGGPAPGCLEAADANDDSLLDLSDPVFLLECLFLGRGLASVPPPGPFSCGSGASFQGLRCDSSPCPPPAAVRG
jgi:hypothetical protein